MLSIAKIPGRGGYYLSLAAEDYYTKGGEPPGHWWGRGAAEFGLHERILGEDQALRDLVFGYSPGRERSLVQNAGDEGRRAGWDLTFSAPKSVSVAWSQAGPDDRQEIQAAHREAVEAALGYLEESVGLTRRGKGGHEQERTGFVAALFEHGVSRALDPQLHTHALVLNVALREDGTSGALHSIPIYHSKMVAGALYRAELALQLQLRLGTEIERDGDWFRLKGVPQDIEWHFSKRREEILEALGRSGHSSARAAAIAALDTRDVKIGLPRAELIRMWQEEGRELGFGREELNRLCSRAQVETVGEVQRLKLLSYTLLELTADPDLNLEFGRRMTHFSESDFIRRFAENAVHFGMSAGQIVEAAEEYLRTSPELVRLGERDGHQRFTSQEIFDLEEQLLEKVRTAETRTTHPVTHTALEHAASKHTLTAEQREALEHLTLERGALQVLSGLAGTGKSHVLGAARDVWEERGYTVIGAALSGKAAQELEDKSQIDSTTLHRLFFELERDPANPDQPSRRAEFKYATWQISKEQRDTPIEERSKAVDVALHATGRMSKREFEYRETVREHRRRFDLSERHVVVVDEAAMVGTRQMARLVEEVHRAGAKLVLVGDSRQLQSIDAGSPFSRIARITGPAKLLEVIRQREGWAREAVVEAALGDMREALSAYAERGLLSVSATREDVQKKLISDWKGQGALDTPEEHLILTATRQQAQELNQAAQEARSAKLSGKGIRLEEETFFVGDRVLFGQNRATLGVRNGDFGTVLQTDPLRRRLTVALDSGERVSFSLREYEQLQLGYAATTHKAQGMTVENAYVAIGGSMQDRELSYVQLSRARGETRLYCDRFEAGDDLEELAKAMERSRRSLLAHELLDMAPEISSEDEFLQAQALLRERERQEKEHIREQELQHEHDRSQHVR